MLKSTRKFLRQKLGLRGVEKFFAWRTTSAAQIFFDENRIEWFDDKHSDEEDRWQVIGMVNEILFVIYTEREDRTRLISARRADKDERRKYYARDENY